ncbi:YceI family protein [Pontibacter sp. H259]|uniref:YceI family protein n=1 Tax=Pontibacter sp. H259 TaxID=3133421 RepID=UPI0030BC65C1
MAATFRKWGNVSIACLLWLAVSVAPFSRQTTTQNDVSKSAISYVLKHPFHTVTGISRQAKSQATIAGNSITAVQVTVPVRSFDSGNRTRDKDMLKVTNETKHPTVTFRSSSITERSSNMHVTGQLTFNGITKQVTFNATQQQKENNLIVDGQFVISLEAYSIKRPSIFSMKVKDELTIKFHMVYPTASN